MDMDKSIAPYDRVWEYVGPSVQDWMKTQWYQDSLARRKRLSEARAASCSRYLVITKSHEPSLQDYPLAARAATPAPASHEQQLEGASAYIALETFSERSPMSQGQSNNTVQGAQSMAAQAPHTTTPPDQHPTTTDAPSTSGQHRRQYSSPV
ncbi:hypothetical protein BDV95DRAFT_101690 [Massariosphaeria phaeospora]|uniref:Uncharacterized protein n=1 Tax=Massariosphaeria phaeospora TaxID=100035 RepID=A0A7C8I4Y5_9PLEO|nr:hypothetical protein BDV95DRAFT_101690 [Massariosphaeria phaeospora]